MHRNFHFSKIQSYSLYPFQYNPIFFLCLFFTCYTLLPCVFLLSPFSLTYFNGVETRKLTLHNSFFALLLAHFAGCFQRAKELLFSTFIARLFSLSLFFLFYFNVKVFSLFLLHELLSGSISLSAI
jgi:hypothetical protein